jgi:hypothetical protein
MSDHLSRFLHLVAWLVLVGATLRTVLVFYFAATYPKSASFLLDKLHGRERRFNAFPSLVWAILAAAWLYAGSGT